MKKIRIIGLFIVMSLFSQVSIAGDLDTLRSAAFATASQQNPLFVLFAGKPGEQIVIQERTGKGGRTLCRIVNFTTRRLVRDFSPVNTGIVFTTRNSDSGFEQYFAVCSPDDATNQGLWITANLSSAATSFNTQNQSDTTSPLSEEDKAKLEEKEQQVMDELTNRITE